MLKENILIFGDSYSTYDGFIPDGYATYYPKPDHITVNDVSKTWWKMLETETNSHIVLNNSWSGSTIYSIGAVLLTDIEKQDGHPTYNGMIKIKNQILNSLL